MTRRGIGEVLGALLILAITLAAGAILYSTLKRDVKVNLAGVSESSRLLSERARARLSLVSSRSDEAATYVLLYNYGEAVRLLEVVTASGFPSFKLYIYTEIGWEVSSDGTIPPDSLALLAVYDSVVEDRVILRLEGGVEYDLKI